MVHAGRFPHDEGGMSRREFIVAGGGALLAANSTGISGGPTSSNLSTIQLTRERGSFELAELQISDILAGLQTGRWSSSELVALYSARIESLDRRGPALRHVLELNPDLERVAEERDRERRAGRIRGPLHGIPVLLKDNVATGDGMTTTAGSLAMEGSRSPEDAFVAGRLRAAGAILLGKTNMSEWANFRSTRSSSGWSSRGGQGRNPVVLDRNPCGSSSGTAGAIAANYASVGIGTETDGSITCPAATVGIVGIKPTVGLVSRTRIIPISVTQDTAGPMTRTVADAALLLTSITGVDPEDPATVAGGPYAGTDYSRYLDRGGLEGKRLGVARARFTGYNDATDRLFEEALGVLRGLGAIVVDPADIPHAGEYDDAEYQVLLYEFKAGLNDYLAALGQDAPVRSLEEVIEFNERNRARVMPHFGQEILYQAQEKGPLSTLAYRRALATCRRLSRTLGIDRVMTRHRLDALVAPTGNPAWPIDLVNGDHFTGSVTTPAAVAGYPHITVPAGQVQGLPVGLSFFGRAWSEASLITMAYAFEQATLHRRPPGFLPTLEIGVPA